MTDPCRVTDRPQWSLEASDLLPEHLDAVGAWLGAHGLNPLNVSGAAVVLRADGSREVHVREYTDTCGCPDHPGFRFVDWTTNEPASRLRILPLLADPPDIEVAWCS